MKILLISLLLVMTACKKEDKEISVRQNSFPETITENKINESDAAKKWLEKSIENYFTTDLGTMDKEMQKITTPEYYDYKTDAMNVDLDVDGSLTEKEFQAKWKNKFDTDKAGIGSGFLITGQDWEEIKVSKCELISGNEEEQRFNVLLSDKNLKAEYPVTIKVVKRKGIFLIADVLQ